LILKTKKTQNLINNHLYLAFSVLVEVNRVGVFDAQVTRLCDLTHDNDTVTSVSWAERGNLVAVGTHRGYVQIWDAAASKKLNVLEGHSARVGALAWNGDMLSSGSRDRLILQRDIRTPSVGTGTASNSQKYDPSPP
jgi:WD40 repeat protein